MVQTLSNDKLLIGFLGADWWGSDARALASEFRRDGHLLIERHYEDHFPTRWRSTPLRLLRRCCRGLMSADYNRAIREMLDVKALDFLLVFKGMLLEKPTLQAFVDRGVPAYCVYPDVSFVDHGKNIWSCLPLYDCVFTTKSFHVEDNRVQGASKRIKLVNHGFDPDVHRPVTLRPDVESNYAADVSFVGVHSPKKEAILALLLQAIPGLRLRIWGTNWEKASGEIQKSWEGRGAYGDEVAAIYVASKINLGLLSEAGGGTKVGDRTTARTWQIPACKAFMLHEDTAEVRQAFEAGREIGVFSDTNDLISKVRYFLEHSAEREAIAEQGYRRAQQAPYSYRSTTQDVLAFHRGQGSVVSK
jgi:spore maturation protein CgeB